MRNDQQRSEATASGGERVHESPWSSIRTHRRLGGLALFAGAAAVALAAFSEAGSSHGAGLGKRTHGGNTGASSQTHRSRASAATTQPNDDATRLLNEWTACEHSRGDSNQAAPTVDAHGVINIIIPPGAMAAGDPHDVTGACSQYLAGAQRALSGGQPVEGWGDEAKYVQYANCMRANGYPTFPYPSGTEPDGHSKTNFNGTGIDPESPAFLNGHANQMCGKQVAAPAWWINSWGPPGDVTVKSGPLGMGPPHESPKLIPAPAAGAVPGATPGQAPTP